MKTKVKGKLEVPTFFARSDLMTESGSKKDKWKKVKVIHVDVRYLSF